MKVLIVDDEARARRTLRSMLEEYCPQVTRIADAGSVKSALKEIHKQMPELVFLDIEMPEEQGFELLEYFEPVPFQVVFTTAYSDFALNAFEVSALDYLLKPIEIERLCQSVSKAEEIQGFKQFNENYSSFRDHLQSQKPSRRVALHLAEGISFLDVEQIHYLQAEGSYTTVVTNSERILVSKKLGEFTELEAHPEFFRSHRSFLLNLSQVEKYIRKDGGYVQMRNGDTVTLSRYKKDDFLEAMSRML